MRYCFSNKNSRQAPFTVVELLSVTILILVIAGLLFPVVNSVKANAKLVQCQSNLRQLSVACISYCGDNRGSFPGRTAPGTTAGTEFSWVGGGNKAKGGYFSTSPGSQRFLSPYVGITDDSSDESPPLKVARCPMDTGAHQPASVSGNITPDGKKYWAVCGTSYGAFNWNFTGSGVAYNGIVIWSGSKEVGSRLLSGVKSPDRYVVMYEAGGFFQLYHKAQSSKFAVNPEAFWHSAKGGYKWGMVFADGHCGYVTVDSDGKNLMTTDQYTCDPTK